MVYHLLLLIVVTTSGNGYYGHLLSALWGSILAKVLVDALWTLLDRLRDHLLLFASTGRRLLGADHLTAFDTWLLATGMWILLVLL